MSTAGGEASVPSQFLLIIGTNLGPVGTPVRVTYGSASSSSSEGSSGKSSSNFTKYEAVGCCVEVGAPSAWERFATDRPTCPAVRAGAGNAAGAGAGAGSTGTHTVVTCKTAPGVGQGLKVLVTVGGQTSAAANGAAGSGGTGISYASPTISSVSGPGGSAAASTAGGEQLLVTGTEFGLAGETDVTVRYGKLSQVINRVFSPY